jgi:cytochrome c5
MNAPLRLIVCAAAIGLALACSPNTDFERMRQQSRADPYDAAASADGSTMRTPPAGSVPVLSMTPAVVRSGAREYGVFCEVCHGRDGSGRSIMARNMVQAPALSLLTRETTARSDADLFDIVSHGRNRMPAYDWALSAAERSAVVAYIRTLQQSGPGATGGTSR